LFKSIDQAKTVELSKFIYALGIRHVGEETAVVLADYFGSFEKLGKSEQSDLEKLSDIGPEVAKSITSWFTNKANYKFLEDLFSLGVHVKKSAKVSHKLAGKSFLFTGSLSLARDEAQELARRAGGKIVSAVSPHLDYLVVGEKPGSKMEKARSLGTVKILSEADFKKLIK